ncbi:hypothetical protein CANARDRAFT_25486 [[Candida] arabinofermentans NRRL YB-2248]|uniref:Uncharacterized protein n=1 Tax=[Candida] arabinofermentans NRRL YB-2248 TaxID=983967 RepID=A0A1E4STR9_9ASCO|nr:hypothetical protein CANARDRAFT_25486 [[Candida] arabinofermentans NRRL YB-2248]
MGYLANIVPLEEKFSETIKDKNIKFEESCIFLGHGMLNEELVLWDGKGKVFFKFMVAIDHDGWFEYLKKDFGNMKKLLDKKMESEAFQKIDLIQFRTNSLDVWGQYREYEKSSSSPKRKNDKFDFYDNFLWDIMQKRN